MFYVFEEIKMATVSPYSTAVTYQEYTVSDGVSPSPNWAGAGWATSQSDTDSYQKLSLTLILTLTLTVLLTIAVLWSSYALLRDSRLCL